MAPRGRSRRQAREDVRGEQVDEAGPAAQAGPVPQEEEDLHRLNRVWHITGAPAVVAQALFIPHARSRLADAVHDRGGIRASHPAPGLHF
ncbi:hypothetical protein PIB30_094846 [Stylosanthes scabra]|uniref:Uncharacterized protein n=1 Tax=Stylosanthes scabra TaxID=79078 RepID=A0ABU6ZUB1_9FABA|nr:hypothetical protein [Stylosanthes scabra]